MVICRKVLKDLNKNKIDMFWSRPRPLPTVFVVTLVSKEFPSETENLGVFAESDEAWEYAESISKDYNKHEWYVLIEEFTLGKPKKPTSEDDDTDEFYPCPIEWN